MCRANRLAIEGPLVRVVVAFGTALYRRSLQIEICTKVFLVAGDARDACILVGFCIRGVKLFGLMTLNTGIFDGLGRGVAGRARVAVRVFLLGDG